MSQFEALAKDLSDTAASHPLIPWSYPTEKSGMGRGFCLSFIFILLGAGCTQTTTSGGTENRNGATVTGPTPATYCSTPVVFAGGTTITGTAEYQVRPITGSGLGSVAQSLLAANTYPIRLAEVRVTNTATGTLVQCTETLADGSFTFDLPSAAATYTVSVNSRIKNANETINVFDAPETNRFYTLSTTVDPTTFVTPLAMVASVDEPEVLSGAFNILDKMLLSNEYLRTKTAACTFFAGCVPFTVAHAVDAYWTPGFNPGSYFNTGSLSFYLPGYYRLFILGGLNGNTSTTDTDHFDNSVIIHEYAHSLEDTVFGSDSPGGSHNGNAIIDPRLAWSEGWGNFFQSAVLVWAGIQSSPRYQDTSGNANGVTSFYYDADLETTPAAAGSNDKPNANSEGVFREFSITRMLNDALDNTPAEANAWAPASTDNITDNFGTIWAALTTPTDSGYKNPKSAFRNVGQLHRAQNLLAGADNWSNLRDIERHTSDMTEYAQYVTTNAACAIPDSTITPTTTSSVHGISENGSFQYSNLLVNNDFYHLKITAAGTYTIQLTYTDSHGSNTTDVDLYLYNSSARFGNSTDILGKSVLEPSGAVGSLQTETVTKSLSVGDYLINVFVYTGSSLGGPLTYRLNLGGVKLCPTDLPN